MPKGNCQFNGKGSQYIGSVIIHGILLSALTFGIYSAWAWVRLLKLKASHTMMNGKPVSFHGTGGQLFIIIILQGLLTFITFGLYFPWAVCKFFRWKAQNTLVEDKPSEFTGTGGSLFLFYLIHLCLLPLLTLGIYYVWGLYRFYSWEEEHARYGGERTSFGGGFWPFLKIILSPYPVIFLLGILSSLTHPLFGALTPIVLVIISPWLVCMFFEWQVKGLAVGDGEDVNHFPPVKTKPLLVIILILIGLLALIGLGIFLKDRVEDLQRKTTQIPTGQVKPRKDSRAIKMPIQKTPPQPAQKGPAPLATKPAPVPPSPAPAEPPSKEPSKEGKMAPTDVDSELKRLDDLINKDDKNADAFYNRGWLYASKGDLQLAEKDYAKAIAIDPKHESAYFNRGLLLVQMKKYELAVNDFSEVIKLNSRALDAYCNRGGANIKLGRLDLAIQDYDTALKIDANDGDLYYNRGVAYLAKGDRPKALADFNKAANFGHNEARKYLDAAIDCAISRFTVYMPPATKMNVERFEAIRGRLEKNFADLYQQAHKLFGERVQRAGDKIRFTIKGEDKRWAEIFGPQWSEMIKQKPNEPRFFMIEAKFGWDQECRVIQRFQACLENPRVCQDKPEEGSALQIKKTNGSWQLVDGKGPKEWKQAFLFGEGLIEIVDWVKQGMTQRGKVIPYEEFMLTLARDYSQRIQGLMSKVAAVK